MAMVNVVTIAASLAVSRHWLIDLVQRSAATWRCVLHSSNEPGELTRWQCHDDSTVNTVTATVVTACCESCGVTVWLQLLGEMDDLTEWFVETERQIAESEPIICDAEKLRQLSRDQKVSFLLTYPLTCLLTYLLSYLFTYYKVLSLAQIAQLSCISCANLTFDF